MAAPVFDSRSERGLAIAKANVITENADGSFSVPSQSVPEIAYRVVALGGSYLCNCPDFKQRHAEIEACKHIIGVKLWLAARVELEAKAKPKVFAEDAIQCAQCGSIRVTHFGSSHGRPAFKCKDCGKRFREQRLIRGPRYSPEMVSLTLDLYFSGTSLRKTARIVNDHFGSNLGKSTLYRWIENFVPKVSEYVNSLSPELSETWQADELFVKMKGGEKETQYGQNSMAYLWNIMDRKTRYLLASKISKHRDVGGAARALMEAKRNAHDSQPERILTDGLDKYREGIRFAFGPQPPQHVARAGIKGKPHANNNRVERLNGTLRERVKVQRGWKSYGTKIAEGQRIQYNFVKPHGALEGQTPAERAGIETEGENKWLSLLTHALRREVAS